MKLIDRRRVLIGLAGSALGSLTVLVGFRAQKKIAEKKMLAPPRNGDFYDADGTFNQDAAKRAYYELMAYHGYPIPDRLRGEDFWTLDFALGNFAEAWSQAPFARYYLNTFILVTSILAAQFVLCTLAAYAFARFQFFGREVAFALVLVQLMIMPEVF